MFLREWRQQILVLALLTVAVAAAISSVTIAYNSGAPDDAEFGSASYLLRFDGTNPRALEAGLDSARKWFGTTEVIGYRSIAVPGSVDSVEFRAQEPHGTFASELLALRRGSYPKGPRQVALTDGVADLLALEIGDALALDGRRRTIVGIVENPRHLTDEFALVSPASAGAPDTVTLLVAADAGSIDRFRASQQVGLSAWSGSAARGRNGQRAGALAMFSVATVFLLLASLVAAAGFAVIAQRRLRQLGMLAATGATPKHLRLVLLTNGAVVGAIGAVIGTVVGLALWFGVLPTLETGFDHRIDPLSLPWTLLVLVILVAMLGATAAAWWPGRAVTRVPVALALSARPPRPKPAHRSAMLAALLIAGGVCSLAFADRTSKPLIVAGLLATILGTLLLGPLAIRIFARAAGHVPIAPRLALRDLARYQARSGAALAAITLALGITAAVVVTAAAEEKQEDERMAAKPPNLSDRQVRVYTGRTRDPQLIPLPIQSPAQLAGSAARVRQLAAGLGQAVVIPVWKPVQPGEPPLATFEGDRAIVAAGLARKTSPKSFNLASGLYVATPPLLRYLGIDPATVDPTADFLADPTVPTEELVILRFRDRKERAVTNVQRIDSREVLGAGDASSDLPSSFVTLHGLRRHGWQQVASGWLVESSRPLTSEQIAAARELAASAGLTIEVQRESTSFAKPIAIATAAGALLALAILALTVGLIRSESAGDLRTLTATGATNSTRRTLTAATAGALALLGALLGVAGAYLALAATYLNDLAYLSRIPILALVLIVVGVPLAATVAGWLLAGREPAAIARPVIE
jgi:putative ABC transport system permease protein